MDSIDHDEIRQIVFLQSAGQASSDDLGHAREVILPLAFSPENGPVVDATVRRTMVLLQAAAVRREALEDERRGLHDEAARKLRRVARTVRDAIDDDEGREEADDLERMAHHLESQTFTVMEAKYMRSRSYSAERSKPSMKDILSRSKREARTQQLRDELRRNS